MTPPFMPPYSEGKTIFFHLIRCAPPVSDLPPLGIIILAKPLGQNEFTNRQKNWSDLVGNFLDLQGMTTLVLASSLGDTRIGPLRLNVIHPVLLLSLDALFKSHSLGSLLLSCYARLVDVKEHTTTFSSTSGSSSEGVTPLMKIPTANYSSV